MLLILVKFGESKARLVPQFNYLNLIFGPMLLSNRITYVTIASTLALVALVFLQVKWVSDSKKMIEEQFNQKVRMAVCSAVESLNRDLANPQFSSSEPPLIDYFSPDLQLCKSKDEVLNTQPTFTASEVQVCQPVEATSDGFQMTSLSQYDLPKLDEALGQALDFYDIPLAYEMEVVSPNSCVPNAANQQYCCALAPYQKSNSDIMSLRFPGKNNYLYGQMRWLLLSSVIILLFITLVFVFANHTLLRQQQVYQMNKDFFNNMAHEFRTPLTNISLANNLLIKKDQTLADNKFVRVVKEESQQLKHQVERVLQLASLENGEYPLAKENLKLDVLIQDVLDGMALQVREKGAEISLKIDTQMPSILGDKFHLGNVFRNLIDNALKYSDRPAKINIALQKHRDGVLILFQDQGRGLAKKDQAFIFDKYHRVINGDRHDQKGFGLGLPYAKMIVERHRGFIKVISDLNKGCRFDLFIPQKS